MKIPLLDLHTQDESTIGNAVVTLLRDDFICKGIRDFSHGR